MTWVEWLRFPDLMAGWQARHGWVTCGAVGDPDGWRCYCTRQPGHRGRHAAANGIRVLAVWANEDEHEIEMEVSG